MVGDKKREILITTKLIYREMDKQTVKQAEREREKERERVKEREKERERDVNYTQPIDRHTYKQTNRKTSGE